MSVDIIKVISNDHELDKYSDPNRLREEAVPYIGQPKKHPSDAGKIFLRMDPLSSQGQVLEFRTEDVVFAEEMNTLTSKNGTSYRITKIWVRKGAVGIKLEPFSVIDLSSAIGDHFNF
ncbi:MAG: hypothetical protein COB67_01835 [SAR324 cluster bacterium]|uniref:Inorganic pyrophosphatase Ppa n=1 Tax=SAR324 cluster bacterium TaxID=2024889 RepID=A0A2A4TA39_9DELT|nr:MAG: hypothetical protein COB67_01835 [SAR324 cluster bacterium]